MAMAANTVAEEAMVEDDSEKSEDKIIISNKNYMTYETIRILCPELYSWVIDKQITSGDVKYVFMLSILISSIRNSFQDVLFYQSNIVLSRDQPITLSFNTRYWWSSMNLIL